MATHNDQRERTLTLARIFQDETDERNPMSLSTLVERLESLGLSGERKSIYRDIAALKRHGLDLVFRNGRGGGWYVAHRWLDRWELSLVLDAVATYRWLSPEQREGLMTKLMNFASVHQRKGLRRLVVRKKGGAVEPEGVQVALEKIHIAMHNRLTLSFVPFTVDGNRDQRPETRRIVTAKGLVWDREIYYLLAWNHKKQTMEQYRLDRMSEVHLMSVRPCGPVVDMDRWLPLPFGPTDERRERVRLRCRWELAGEILDVFGSQVLIAEDGEWMQATGDVALNQDFWGWMVAHAEMVTMAAPTWAAKIWEETYRPKSITSPPGNGTIRA